MQAVLVKQAGDASQLYLGEAPKPIRNEGELLIQVKATALNRADILQREGKYPPPKGASQILGLECAGIVLETPVNSRFEIGDNVFALLSGGGYAEYVTIPEVMAMPIPENLSFTEAAAMPEVFLTAYQALVWLADLQPKERVLIHAGASGVGTAAIQIAKSIGAEVIITASKPKHIACHQLGADLCIDYQSEDFAKFIQDYTKDEGVDVIIDFIAASYFQQNINSLRLDGRLIMLALLGGVQIEALNILPIVTKRLKIYGSTLRSRNLDYQAKLTNDWWAFAQEKGLKKSLKPVIDKVFDWKDVEKAHQKMEQNKNIGKIVLEIT